MDGLKKDSWYVVDRIRMHKLAEEMAKERDTKILDDDVDAYKVDPEVLSLKIRKVLAK